MFDCAICTVPILGETIVYTPLSRLWISPVMRLPSLSSIVGDASAPAARPSNAAAKQVLINIFIDATLYASVRHASYYSKREKGSGSFLTVDDTKIYATLFVLPSFETTLSKLPLPVALRMRSTSTCPPTDGHSYVCAIDCQLQPPGAFAIVRGRLDLQSSVA